MSICLDKELVEDIIDMLRGVPDNLHVIDKLINLVDHAEQYKKEDKELQNQEIWIKCFYNGYFYQFKDMSINVQIHENNPNFSETDRFKGTTTIFPPLLEEDGKVDLTPLLGALLNKMKEKPNGKFKCYATGFSRQFHFDKNLLSAPMPEGMLKMFGIKNDKE